MDERTADRREPASVAELATMRAWTVTAVRNRWTTAERTIEAHGRRWVVGLTPTAGGATALMLWRDDVVVAHRRGPEGVLCQLAVGWVTNLLAGRPWDAGKSGWCRASQGV